LTQDCVLPGEIPHPSGGFAGSCATTPVFTPLYTSAENSTPARN